MKRLVKICVCKAEHPADARGFCSVCNTPLGRIVPRELDDASPIQATEKLHPSDQTLVRCSACGSLTRPMAFCDDCNQELKQSGPDLSASAEVLSVKLEMIVGSQSFECKDGDIFGKEGTLASQIFQGIGTVSRRHALVTHKEGRWFLTVFAGVQNATQLDGQELRRGVSYPLTADHQLKLSHACEVHLRVSSL